MKVYCLFVNGSGGVGKDTFIEYCFKYLKASNLACSAYSSIEAVKKMLSQWNVDVTQKTEENRLTLSIIGDALENHSEFRSSRCIGKVFQFIADKQKTHSVGVFFLHVREPRMIEKISKELRAFKHAEVIPVTVKIVSDRVPPITSNNSDAGVNDMIYDDVINNSGTLEELDTLAFNFLESLEEKDASKQT